MSKLTDEQLDKLEEAIAAMPDCAGPMTEVRDGTAHCTTLVKDGNYVPYIRWLSHAVTDMPALLAELRELRALLATPMPCDVKAPEVRAVSAWHKVVDIEGSDTLTPDEAIALGVALIRAALAAWGGK